MAIQGNFPRKVAVTGGLSCGKSTVCRFFKDLGAYTVSADEIVHRLLDPNSSIGNKVLALLDLRLAFDDTYNDQRALFRSEIAKKVFQQPTLLRSLENLLHPAVHKEIENLYQYAASQGFPLFVAEIPLLFEIHEERFYDATIAVIADPKLCMERFQKTSGYTEDEYHKRMARQMDPRVKAQIATYTIENDHSLEEIRAKVLKIYAEMRPNNPKGV